MISVSARQCNNSEASATAGASVVSRTARALLAALLVAACSSFFPASAFAEVYGSDLIVGKTVAERGLSDDECPDVEASHVMLVGADGTVYFSRDADAQVKIASITKVMTAVVALEKAPLDLTVTVDTEAATVGESSAGLLEGDSMDLNTALYALLIPSGNDAGIAIAKSVGAYMTGDESTGYDAFISAMNEKAAELGMSESLYTNPHGLDFGAFGSEELHSSAKDVATVVSYAMKNDTFREIVDAGDTTIAVNSSDGSQRAVSLISTDELIGVYDGICGVKTGTTDDAGYCFAAAVNRASGEFYSVVLDSPTSEDRFADTVELMDWVYGNLESRSLINTGQYVDYNGASVPLVAKVAHNDWVDTTIDATVADPDLTAEVFKVAGAVSAELTLDEQTGDIHAGDVMGTLVFSQDGKTIAQTNVIAVEDVAAPNFFEGIGVAIDRWIRGMQGQQLVAESQDLTASQPLSDR